MPSVQRIYRASKKAMCEVGWIEHRRDSRHSPALFRTEERWRLSSELMALGALTLLGLFACDSPPGVDFVVQLVCLVADGVSDGFAGNCGSGGLSTIVAGPGLWVDN